MKDFTRFIETGFPIKEVSFLSKKEKSARFGHISTLQFWWARRPLATCRAALFTSLIPSSPDRLLKAQYFAKNKDAFKDNPVRFVNSFVKDLSDWSKVKDGKYIEIARCILKDFYRDKPPIVVDSFAGGGSFPLEALRLGCKAIGNDLNPVSATLLKFLLELLPQNVDYINKMFSAAAESIFARLQKDLLGFSVNKETPSAAFFWFRTARCPSCSYLIPLLKDFSLAKTPNHVVFSLHHKSTDLFICSVNDTPSKSDINRSLIGTVQDKGILCLKCNDLVSYRHIQNEGKAGRIGEYLFAERVKTFNGFIYKPCAFSEKALLQLKRKRLSLAKYRRIFDQPLDRNGIRHSWSIQYGVNTFSDLFNERQKLFIVLFIKNAESWSKSCKDFKRSSDDVKTAVMILLSFLLNRLAMYNSRHSWWQSSGEFPANIFTRQAIPFIWNYVEIPFNSPFAGGFSSAKDWIIKAIENLKNIPNSGISLFADASDLEIKKESVDVVAIDPPYYDSITYAYLSDFFYVLMRPLLKAYLPTYFKSSLTSKSEEAIVDRPHKLAPFPKDDFHFRKKMNQAFKEVRRILKPSGRFILMYGHKSPKAWEAFLQPLYDSGFEIIASWPVRTERNEKFGNSLISSLSTSVILVCKRVSSKCLKTKRDIGYESLRNQNKTYLHSKIKFLKKQGLNTLDITSSMIAPICSLFFTHSKVLDENKSLSFSGFLEKISKDLGIVKKGNR